MKIAFIITSCLLMFACGGETVKQTKKEVPLATEDYIERYENTHELKITGTLKNGERDGIWTAWFKNGTVESEAMYADGLRHGKINTWYESGKLRYTGFYANGELFGEWIYYSPEGEELKRVKY
jgi:antitoxin component YwqK of YwqJK toxin-antitoxin module